MIEDSPTLPSPTPAPAGKWSELLLYLGGGLGVFVVASIGVGLLVRQSSIGLSLAAYALNVICLGGAAVVLGKLRHRWTWAEFGLRRFHWGWLALAIAITLGLLPLRAAVGLAAQSLFGGVEGMQFRMDMLAPGTVSWSNFLVTLLGAGVLAPIAEEFYFRGLIHRWFQTRFTFWPRILLSSAIFALGHVDAAGVVAGSFIMGLALAAVYEYGHSLWVPIAVHVFNNSLAVVLLYAVLALMRFFPGLATGLY